MEINAAKLHDPEAIPGLLETLYNAGYTQSQLGPLVDVAPRYLRMIAKGERNGSYGLQVMLEALVEKLPTVQESSTISP